MRIALLSLLILVSAACGPTIRIERDATAPIAPGSSWSWGVPDRDGLAREEGAVVPDDSVHRMILGAIEAELTGRGFPRVESDASSFVVHFHVGRRSVLDTLPPLGEPRRDGGAITAQGTWGGYGRPESVDDRTVEWEEGMLIVDVLERTRGVVAWRGIIAGEIREAAGVRPEPAIRDAVRSLLRKFP
jgi:hypothetical protein